METAELFDEERYGDWHDAFAAADASAKRAEIERVIWSSTEHGDYAETTIRGVFAMKAGNFGALRAWCDTTGWDCQAGGDWSEFATEEEAHGFVKAD